MSPVTSSSVHSSPVAAATRAIASFASSHRWQLGRVIRVSRAFTVDSFTFANLPAGSVPTCPR